MACTNRPITCDDGDLAKMPVSDLLRRCIVVVTDDSGEDVLDAAGNKMLAVRIATETCAASGSSSGSDAGSGI
jgi:hypothetical protein